MTEDALFNLRWDAQRSALLGSMATLYREEAFVDTTIVADNKIFKAHKLLLSASSSYLKHMLESVPTLQHAVIFMPHISASDLGNLLKFIYDGEIKINKGSLKSFLAVAKLLRIKGMDFELNEDLDSNINIPTFPPAFAQNVSATTTSTTSSIPSPSNPNKRLATEARLDEDIKNVKIFSSTPQVRINPRSTPPKENGQSYNTLSSNNATTNNNSSDEESRVNNSRPALISAGSGRSTDSSISSHASNNNNNALSPHNSVATPRLIHHLNNNISNGDDNSQPSPPTVRVADDGGQDDSNASDNGDKNSTALNLHIGRYNHHDNESLDMDGDSRPLGGDDREGENSIPDNEMDDEYDDDDDSFSMSIQPEVSLRESDESFNINDRRQSLLSHKPTNFSNSFNLSMLGNSAMSVTPTAGGCVGGGGASSPLSLQHQLTLKHLSKLARPMIPKAHQLPGQGSPQSGGMPSINEGILMRMMREPLQGGSCSKPMITAGNSGFFDISHNDPNLHSAGLRKQKRYVQCTSCSKVLSSLSALKRHMEDVHCARIQGKCLLCGRVYSSRNSLLTHVYSAHKKHSDYKAVARIIRESDFEQFATA